MSVWSVLRRYPFVAITVLVALVCGLVLLTPVATWAPWIASAWALVVACRAAVGMIRSLVRGAVGIDVLAILAVTSTVLVGQYWAALVVCLMLTGGEALEDYATQRAHRDLSALLHRRPRLAHVIRADGDTTDVPVDRVAIGDVLLIKPAELVPVDATLVDHAASFDTSQLTGESLPVELAPGDGVYSGSVNGETAVRVRAERRAEDSQFQAIIRLVEAASASRPKVVRLADRYSVPFTAISLAIAGIAWWVSGDPVRFAEVLVVATPCPLLIAAPVAFIAGMSRASRAGVIVKGGDVLERLARAKTVAFDKTGTLTSGAPTLARIVPEATWGDDTVLALAAAAERYSTHVLASAIVEGATARGIPHRNAVDAREVPTNGVSARVDGHDVLVGKRSYLESVVGPFAEQALEPGELAVSVAIDGVYAGALILRDPVRPDAAAVVEQLQRDGVATMMLTGDQDATARFVAHEVGIRDVRAALLPSGKVDAVAHATARPVVMVGDGVNDAPVLAAADVGIAMGARGATAASDSADAVILVDAIGAVATIRRIAVDTVRIARQSIWLGIALSIVLMVIAAFGVLPAVLGAWLQEAVDLTAILGALRAVGPRHEPRVAVPPAAHVVDDARG